MSLAEYVTRQQVRIDAALERWVPPKSALPESIHKAMRYSLFAGGKRIRPILCLAASEAVSDAPAAIESAACTLELVHTYSLIHDDLPALDNDDLRRGVPTCHKVFGEAIAILAGDALLTLAFQVLAQMDGESGRKVALIAELSTAAGTVGGMIGGQVCDLEGEGREASAALLETIHRAKTGALLRASLRMGGIYAGADREQLDALSCYGEHVGLAFQIIDDVLDVEQSSEALGKTAGKDAQQHKITFPAVYGLERSRAMAEEQRLAAHLALRPFDEGAQRLRELADFIVHRRAKRQRLDLLVVERGLVESREKARALILAGQVLVNGQKADKAGANVDIEATIEMLSQPRYVGRGGLKLEAALDHFGIAVDGKVCLDVGSSTGGFTDCLLQRGASRVYAIDAGTGQLDWKLRNDPRVIVHEQVNARYLSRGHVPEPIDLAVCDVSFISITMILPALGDLLASHAEMIILVKPQFELERQQVGKGGIVRDPELHLQACRRVEQAVEKLGFRAQIIPSPVLGAEGNQEFLLHARH